LGCFNPRGIRRSKAFWEGQSLQGWREDEDPGRGLFGNWGERIALSLPEYFSLSILAGRGHPAISKGRPGAACAPGRGLEGAHKGLPSREMTAPLCSPASLPRCSGP
jgi:hypothetical protein